MRDMGTKFQLLHQKNAGQAAQNQASELLKRIVEEAMKMKKEVEDKLRKTEGEGLLRVFGAVAGMLFSVDGWAETVVIHVFVSLLLTELEDKIQRLLKSKEEKEAEVSQLLKEADFLRQHIAKRADEYLGCTLWELHDAASHRHRASVRWR